MVKLFTGACWLGVTWASTLTFICYTMAGMHLLTAKVGWLAVLGLAAL